MVKFMRKISKTVGHAPGELVHVGEKKTDKVTIAVIDYDENFNPKDYYSPDVFRASDHDPVIVGLMLN